MDSGAQVRLCDYHPIVFAVQRDGIVSDILVANGDLSWDMVTSNGQRLHIPGPSDFNPLIATINLEESTEHILQAVQHLVDWIGENLDR